MGKLHTEYVNLSDIRIAYTQNGSGKNLILLHGNSESKAIFTDYQTTHFSSFHTYALDSRAHGQSQSNDKELSIDQFSDDVIRFCREQQIDEASVIGYSDGGNIALFLAKKEPKLFTRVIAISPNTLVSGTTDESLQLFRRMMKVMKLFYMKKSLMRFELMMNDIGLSEEDLAGIRTKVVILYAEKDMIKEEHIQYIAQSIPNAQLSKVNGCTHMNIYKSEAAIQIMQNFLMSD